MCLSFVEADYAQLQYEDCLCLPFKERIIFEFRIWKFLSWSISWYFYEQPKIKKVNKTYL